MARIKAMDDVQLQKELRRLKRDVEDFRMRAANVAASLEHSGRSVGSDPLHQRFTSIHGFLVDRLEDVEHEVSQRAAAASANPRWSLRSLFRPSPAPVDATNQRLAVGAVYAHTGKQFPGRAG